MNAEATTAQRAVVSNRTHDLWLGDRVLTITIPGDSKGFGPDAEGLAALAGMIRDLSRATKAVVYRVENDGDGSNAEFHTYPIDGISDAIILLSQLAEAVNAELHSETK
ncbi:hypothetical protein [Lysobacter terrae]